MSFRLLQRTDYRGSVLLVEPDVRLARRTAAGLEWAGWDAYHTSTGQGALSRAMTMLPDLVIVDEGVADMDWMELLLLLRLSDPRLKTPVLCVPGPDCRDRGNGPLDGAEKADMVARMTIEMQEIPRRHFNTATLRAWASRLVTGPPSPWTSDEEEIVRYKKRLNDLLAWRRGLTAE